MPLLYQFVGCSGDTNSERSTKYIVETKEQYDHKLNYVTSVCLVKTQQSSFRYILANNVLSFIFYCSHSLKQFYCPVYTGSPRSRRFLSR